MTPIEKPYIKRLNNIDMLCELPFYNELNIIKTWKAFKEAIQLLCLHLGGEESIKMRTYANKGGGVTSMWIFAHKFF